MLLPITEDLIPTTPFDVDCASLADRHYSRQTPGSNQFMGNGRKLVLRDTAGLVVFGWLWSGFRRDGELGYNNVIFRNESSRLSSDIILEAERLAVAKWGPNRAFTYIDPEKIRSVNPGFCFKMAGWKLVGMSQHGKHLLEKNLT